MTQFELNEAKGAAAPGAKEKGRTKEVHQEQLDGERTRQYRALVARANCLALGRLDFAFAVKELAKRTDSPTERAWARPKHL